MHRLRSAFAQFLADVRAQKLRTALTVLGITWGTVAVVVLLAFGVGLERQTLKRFHGLGDRVVILFGGRTQKPFEGFPDGRFISLREEDAVILRREIPEIVRISPEYSGGGTPVRRGRSITNPNVTGIYPSYSFLRNVIPDSGGRFINDGDLAGRRRVAVLGDELKDHLFGEEEAVGRQVFIGRTPFTVIGVMRPKQQSSSYNSRDKDRIFIPASTHRTLFGRTTVSNIVYRVSDARLSKAVERRVYEILGRKYRFDPTDEDALGVWDTAEFEKLFGYLFLAFNIFFALVGSFTLTVGGIGVANIMYIVVRERTREIGIRRSVGARRTDIMRQFFLETLGLVAVGAMAGFLVSVGVVRLMTYLPLREFVGVPVISGLVALTTITLLGLIAGLAGFFPARRAASLDPVECIRS